MASIRTSHCSWLRIFFFKVINVLSLTNVD
nr:MAG TPA: hypothetical protein [Caudoviricetes sp.]